VTALIIFGAVLTVLLALAIVTHHDHHKHGWHA